MGDEFDPKEILSTITSNWRLIASITSIFALISVIYSLSLTNIYTASAQLSPSSNNNSSNSLAQYAGLASMAGISLGENNSAISDTQLALSLIKSKTLLKRLINNKNILPDLMAAKKWNIGNNSVIYDEDLFDMKEQVWVRDVDFPFNVIPSLQEAHIEFTKLISVSQDTKTQLITIRVSHLSPTVAYKWTKWVIEEVNLLVADMRITEAESSINYLNEQLLDTPFAELRTMLYGLMQQNTQSMMLAKIRPEYALTTIDAPLVPEMKSYPVRSVICIIITLFGLMIAILVVFIRHYVFDITRTQISPGD